MRKLYLKKTRTKRGVFAGKEFKKGQKILSFEGIVVEKKELLPPVVLKKDHFIQIGKSMFLGASGWVDDFVNHSCDPNCIVKIKGKHAFLFAIRNIKEEEEITFDYSTTMRNDNSVFRCRCARHSCRKVVKEFKYLPTHTKRKYIILGAPRYVYAS